MMVPRLFFVLIATFWVYPDPAYALFEAETTFGSFYGRDWSSTLIWGGVGIVIAAALGAAVFFTGGVASPVVAPGASAIGTLIGNFMGLTGAAATNAGLAFVGGGSIAAGGWGMAGGAAIFTVVSGVAFDAATIGGDALYTSVKEERNADALYARLVNSSKGLITFPLPTKSSGSDALKEAMSTLGDVDNQVPLSVGTNRLLIRRAITQLRWSKDERETALAALVHIDKDRTDTSVKNQESVDEAVNVLLQSAEVSDLRDAALLSVYYFILNDYTKAKHYAVRATEIARTEDPEGYTTRTTLPTFISATCSLYDKQVDYKLSLALLKEAMLAEPDNKLVPLLFSIFLDRYTLRSMTDANVNLGVFSEVFDIMRTPSLADFRLTNYIMLLGRYLIHIENERLKVMTLASASDETIRNHPKTLPYVKDALKTYGSLLRGATDVESNIVVLSSDGLNEVQKQAIAALLGESKRALLEREELWLLVRELERDAATK